MPARPGSDAVGTRDGGSGAAGSLGRDSDAMLAGYWLAYANFQAGNRDSRRARCCWACSSARASSRIPGATDLRIRLLMALGLGRL